MNGTRRNGDSGENGSTCYLGNQCEIVNWNNESGQYTIKTYVDGDKDKDPANTDDWTEIGGFAPCLITKSCCLKPTDTAISLKSGDECTIDAPGTKSNGYKGKFKEWSQEWGLWGVIIEA